MIPALRTLQWRWRLGPWDPLSPSEAQACEYAEVMGQRALWRQWKGGTKARRRVERSLQRTTA